jgi:hypothetical protein
MPDGQSAVARGVAEGYRFIANGLHHAQTDGVIQLVHIVEVIAGFARPAALEHRDLE